MNTGPHVVAMTGAAQWCRIERRRRRVHAVTIGLIFAVVGFLLGVVLVGIVWLITFARALSGESTLNLPGLIEVVEEPDMTATVLGPLLLLSPLMFAAIAAMLGFLVTVTRPPAHDATAT